LRPSRFGGGQGAGPDPAQADRGDHGGKQAPRPRREQEAGEGADEERGGGGALALQADRPVLAPGEDRLAEARVGEQPALERRMAAAEGESGEQQERDVRQQRQERSDRPEDKRDRSDREVKGALHEAGPKRRGRSRRSISARLGVSR